MKIETNKFVSATYDLYVGGEDGKDQELMEKATVEHPLSFIYGSGMMLEAFEKKLAGLAKDGTFDFTLPSVEAYGEYFEDHVVDIPRSVFEVDGEIDEKVIFENNTVPMMDQDGNHLNGTIVKIEAETVKMDFNHPLAGEDLHFVGKILEVREPTEQEIKQFTGDGCCEGGCGSCGSGEGEEECCGCGCDH